MIGRAQQQAELDAARRDAARGRFRCVLLLGDPGVGKSRLATEALARGGSRSIALKARAHPLGETSPFGLWAEALEGHLRVLAAQEVTKLAGGFLDDLAGLLRSAAAARGSAPSGEPPRVRLMQGMVELLWNLTTKGLVQIMLDDIHLADASSWETLHYLARNLSDSRILVIATARRTELSRQPIARQILESLEKDGVLKRMHIPPLDAAAVAELAEAAIGRQATESLVIWLAEQSRGNPMFALSLLDALLEQGGDLGAPKLRSLPDALTELVTNQLEGLGDADLATLELLSVYGARVEFTELAKLSSRPTDRLEPILQRLVHSRLVIEEERGRDLTYEVAHPLIREVVYQQIDGARRRSIHRLVARALLDSGRLGAAAPHFVRSAGVGDAEAIEALADAVRQAEKQEAFREALIILSSLMQLIPAGDARWLDVLDALNWEAEWVVDHRADAHAVMAVKATREIERILERSGDSSKRARVKLRLASFLAWGMGALEEAETSGRDALALFVEAGDGNGVLLAEAELAWIDSLKGRFADAEARARKVEAEAKEAGHTLALVQAVRIKGYQLLAQGKLGEAEQIVRVAVDMARQSGNPYRLIAGLSALALILALQGQIPEALLLLEECKREDAHCTESVLLEWSAMVEWFAGDFSRALDSMHESLAVNAGALSRRRGYAVPFAAVSAAELGQLEEAERLARKSREIYGTTTWSFCGDYCSWGEAFVLARRGRLKEATELLHGASMSMLSMQAWPWAAPPLLDLAEISSQAGAEEVAEESASQLEKIAQRVGFELYWGLAGIGRAWAQLGRQQNDAAQQSARLGLDRLSESGCQAFVGRGYDVLGRSLATKDREEAVDALGKASAIFEQCKAVERKASTVHLLKGLGSRGRRAAAVAKGPDKLTPREKEIVKLTTQGFTARQIADELVLSRRTVETHLSNAYAKLGVSSKLRLVGSSNPEGPAP